jgi:predicted nucleic acid-binding protein
LTETVNLANARSGTRVAILVLDLLEQSAGIRIDWIGTARFDFTQAFFRKHADQQYSFTDCFAISSSQFLNCAPITAEYRGARAQQSLNK